MSTKQLMPASNSSCIEFYVEVSKVYINPILYGEGILTPLPKKYFPKYLKNVHVEGASFI